MSKTNKQQSAFGKEVSSGSSVDSSTGSPINLSIDPPDANRGKIWWKNWWVIAVIGVLSLGVLGSGLKYLDESAARELAKRNAATPLNPVKDESALNAINPFLPAPLPTATPQLAKEYIYAGSRLLAVEDANATASQPADLAVWRPTTGVWWVMGGNGSQQVGASWGSEDDEPVPGDYDGDGKTDFSVFRPADNTWYIFRSSDSSISAPAFGSTDDIPSPADFDGDGRTDVALYRPSNGTWYWLNSGSGNSFSSAAFGLATDLPAAADYDGDGKADIAVWRGSNTSFYSLNSSNGYLVTATVGVTSSQPVCADYDGDGKANYAVRNGADWVIRNEANTANSTISWQQAADIAVHNDYDGDGKVDIAVWRNTDGKWFIRQSSQIGQAGQTREEQWGQTGDIPVPSFYKR